MTFYKAIPKNATMFSIRAIEPRKLYIVVTKSACRSKTLKTLTGIETWAMLN